MSEEIKITNPDYPSDHEQALNLLKHSDIKTLRLGKELLEQVVSQDTARGEIAETKAFGILQTSCIGATLLAGLVALLVNDALKDKLDSLVPLLVWSGVFLLKAVWRAFLAIKVENYGVLLPSSYLDIQGKKEEDALSCYVAELINMYAFNFKINSKKHYQFYCSVIDSAFFIVLILAFAVVLMGELFYAWTIPVKADYWLVGLLGLVCLFADWIFTRDSKFWTHLPQNFTAAFAKEK